MNRMTKCCAISIAESVLAACAASPQVTAIAPAAAPAMLEPHLIPYSDSLTGPPICNNDSLTEESPANKRPRLILQERMESINVHGVAFEKVRDMLQDSMYANIYINWTTMQEAGIDRTTPVTLNLHYARYEQILHDMLEQLGPGKFGYTVDDGVITITTQEDLQSPKYQVVRVFDIRDMLPKPDAAHLFTRAVAKEKIVTEIEARIKTSVAPQSWRDAGGQVGSIRAINGRLIVNQTLPNQRAIYQLLEKMRKSKQLPPPTPTP